MPEPVRRGGRVDAGLLKQEAEAREKAENARKQHLADVRSLSRLPEFQRYVKHWMAETGAFGIVKIFTAESYWIQGRREVGMQMWNELAEADPRAMVQFLDVTTDTPQE